MDCNKYYNLWNACLHNFLTVSKSYVHCAMEALVVRGRLVCSFVTPMPHFRLCQGCLECLGTEHINTFGSPLQYMNIASHIGGPGHVPMSPSLGSPREA